MYTYNIDGTNYTFDKEIGEEEARRRVTPAPSAGFRNRNKNPRYEGFFTEAGEGVVSGLTKIPEGIISTGTLISDAITGGNATGAVEAWFDNLREEAGIDPEGAAGKVTEALVQFGIPGLYAASAISKVGKLATGTGKAGSLFRPDRFITGPGTRVTSSLLKRFAPDTKKALTNIERRRRIREGEVKIGTRKVGETDARQLSPLGSVNRARDIGTKSQKVGRYAVMASAAGFADAIVSTDDTQTLGDFFEAGPTNTVDAVGKEGQERAFAKIWNKMKVGVEGGVATAVLPPAFLASLNVVNRTLAARPAELLDKLSPTLGSGLGKALPTGKQTTVLDLASGFTVPLAREGLKRATASILEREQNLLTRGLTGDDSVGTLAGIIGRMEAIARYRGFLSPEVARVRSLINPEVEGNIKVAQQQMQEIDGKIKELLKTDRYTSLPDQHKRKYIDNFMDVLEGAEKRFNEAGLTTRQIEKAQEMSQRITDLPDDLYKLYREAKLTIEGLTDQFVKSNVVKELPEQTTDGSITRAEFVRQITRIAKEGGYLRRQYRIYNDKNFKLDPKAKNEIVNKIVTGEGVDIGHVRGILSGTSLNLTDARAAELYAGRLNFTREEATRYIDEVTSKAKQRMGNRGIGLNRIFQNRLDVSLIQKRKVDSDVLKAILGEIRDPREAFISTVSELSNFIATDKFLQLFKNSADANIAQVAARNSRLAEGAEPEKQIFFNMNDEIINVIRANPSEFQGIDLSTISRADQLDAPSIQKAVSLFERNNPNHVILGRSADTVAGGNFTPGANASKSIYGTMFGYAVPRVMFNNLSNSVWTDADTMPTFLRQAYGTMQKLKGMTQYAKTILSPLTQVRNVTSAAGFALAQGNYGKGSSLGTSVNTVLRDVIDKELKIKNITFLDLKRDGKTLDFLVDMQKRGVIGSSAQLREIQDNLRKGLGYEAKGDFVASQVKGELQLPGEVGGAGGVRSPEFKVTRRSKLGQFFEGPLNLAEDLYRGGDDIWKIYNYHFELQKLRNARRKMHNDAIQV